MDIGKEHRNKNKCVKILFNINVYYLKMLYTHSHTHKQIQHTCFYINVYTYINNKYTYMYYILCLALSVLLKNLITFSWILFSIYYEYTVYSRVHNISNCFLIHNNITRRQ